MKIYFKIMSILMMTAASYVCVTRANERELLSLSKSTLQANNQAAIKFLESGVNPNVKDEFGNTPLIYASARINVIADPLILLTALLAHGADINAQNNVGLTPLITAILANNPIIVEFLLKNGANPNLARKSGETPLAIALKNDKDPRIFELLKNYGAHR